LKNKLKKIKWKNGSSLLEFAIILPSVCMILFAFIMVAQLALCRQTLEHALYLSARAAVVCEDYNTAAQQMNSVAVATIRESTFGVDDNGISTSLTLVAGTTGNGATGSSANGITWEKGALAECSITVSLQKMLAIGPDSMSSKIYVMVERPVPTYY